MADNDSNIRIEEFQQADHISGRILGTWLRRCGVERTTVLNEILNANRNLAEIGEKSFRQWTSDNESSKRVSGFSSELRGDRLVAIVRWFLNEHIHRLSPVIKSSELRQLIKIYPDIPIKNRLQLKRLLHDLEIHTGERLTNFSFAGDWRNHLAEWPVFCFVLDAYWTIRASTCYEMAMVGYDEEDMQHWSWWHRLAASSKGVPKFMSDSPRYPLRGPYADVYYCHQLERFKASTVHFEQAGDQRLAALMDLLHAMPRFNELWSKVSCPSDENSITSMGFPVPFFRKDGTLLWMLEVSTIIPGTPGFQLIIWAPLNEESAEYQAEIRRWADESGFYSRKVFFIEEYANYFSQKERFALGIDSCQ